MTGVIDRQIRRFLFRVRVGRFLGATCEAVALLGLTMAGAVLVARLFGVSLEPHPAWLALLAPAAAWGVMAVRRSGFGRQASAAHLDRRLGLDGLLVSALEVDPRDYIDRIDGKLQRAREALPRLRPRPLLLRIGTAAALIAIVAFLPPLAPARAGANPLAADALDEFAEKLKDLEEQEGLREETREELGERLADLKERFDKHGEVAWKDLDALEQQLEHEQNLQAARLEKARQDLAAFARGEDRPEGGAAASAERMAALLKDVERAGLLDKLPDGLRQKLGANGQGLDAAQLQQAFGSDGLRQLAGALAQAAGDALDGLAGQGLPEGLELADLDELLEGMKGLDGEPCGLCKGDPGDKNCPG